MKKIFLIAGHQSNTGANGLLKEGEETIRLRNLIHKYLRRKNIEPIVDDDCMVLPQVVKWLRKKVAREDICIDIHFNCSSNADAHGTEVFIPDQYTADEKQLADRLLATITQTLGTRNRGVKKESQTNAGRIAMLSSFDCCNLLIEVCFISNQSDVEKYKARRNILAEAIAEVIAKALSHE